MSDVFSNLELTGLLKQPRRLLWVGFGALLVCVAGWFLNPDHFFRSWLFAYLFWLAISLGSLAFVMISHMTGGEWGVIMRRFAEASIANLPFMAICFIPFIFGYKHLFPWANLDFYDHDPDRYQSVIRVLHHRMRWFNPWMFTIRSFIYFAIWMLFAFVLLNGSRRLDRQDNPRLRRHLRMISAAGVVTYFITITSFSMDFLMSRETHWYSSILGFIVAIGQGTAAMSFVVLAICYFAKHKPFSNVLRPSHLNDYGNLLLTLVILWAYTSFSQLLVIWNGNMKDDIGFYTHRGLGVEPNPWRWVALLLIVGHFFAPFLLLLMRGLKQKVPTLTAIAGLLLVMRIVDTLWMTAPSGPDRQLEMSGVYWTDLFTFVGIGSIWLFLYLFNLSRKPMLVANASDQPAELNHGIAETQSLGG